MWKLLKILGLNLLKIFRSLRLGTGYIRGYFVYSIMNGLEETGIAFHMSWHKKIDLKKYCREHKLNYEKIKYCMDYLYEIGIVDIDKSNTIYSFTSKGKRLVYYATGMFTIIYGYSPIFNNLENIFKNKITYNKDISRLGKYVGKGTGKLHERVPFPVIFDIIKNFKFTHILDLGCGDATFLRKVCEELDIKGYGVDISTEVLTYANRLIKEDGLSDQIRLYHGDILEIDKIEFENKKAIDLVLSTFVMHEFFNRGKDGEVLKNALKKIRETFPGSKLLLNEIYRKNRDSLKKSPTSLCEHHLFHELSEQGLPTDTEWENIFKDIDFKILYSYKFKLAGLVFYLLDTGAAGKKE